MQAVFTSSSSFDPASRFHFAGGRDYMMRSEKRAGSGTSGSGTPGKRPPRRRRKKAGFFYKLLMLVLLLVLWPFGLIMLWQRKLRWGVSTKLLTSVVTLAACILLFAFALTVNTGNPEYTAFQDKVNDYLDVAADSLVDAGDIIADKAELVYAGASELGEALWESSKLELADAIDLGVELTTKARIGAVDLWDKFMVWVESTGNQTTEETAKPESTEDVTEEATPEATAKPTPVPTARPIAEVMLASGDTELPIYLPAEGETAGEGRALTDGMLQRNGVLEEGPLPTPVVTPEPTPEPIHFIIKPAGEAIVYYNDGGICYHMASACGSMKTSKEHTFADTASVDNRKCNKCGSPDKALLDETYIVWLDGKKVAHLTDECEEFQGKWSLTSAADAIERERAACETCEADRYLQAIADGREPTIEAPAPEVTPEPTAEPTIEPTEAPTEEPTAEPTEVPTEEPTEAPAEENSPETAAESAEESSGDSTKEPTETPTKVPTKEPTKAPTKVPTKEPTEVPTEEPTEAPTEEPALSVAEELDKALSAALVEATATEAPTAEPTEVPTPTPTAEPTKVATEAPIATPATEIITNISVKAVVMVTPTATAVTSGTSAAETAAPAVTNSADLQVITPSVTLKPAAEATVYHSSNGKWYHTFNRCSGMTGGGAYTLAECVDHFKCCTVCGAPKEEMIGQTCMWKDETGLCHTSDTCATFSGQYTLVLRDEALAESMPACSACGAQEYLTPGVHLNLPAN